MGYSFLTKRPGEITISLLELDSTDSVYAARGFLLDRPVYAMRVAGNFANGSDGQWSSGIIRAVARREELVPMGIGGAAGGLQGARELHVAKMKFRMVTDLPAEYTTFLRRCRLGYREMEDTFTFKSIPDDETPKKVKEKRVMMPVFCGMWQSTFPAGVVLPRDAVFVKFTQTGVLGKTGPIVVKAHLVWVDGSPVDSGILFQLVGDRWVGPEHNLGELVLMSGISPERCVGFDTRSSGTLRVREE
jgi:hypothetical protein